MKQTIAILIVLFSLSVFAEAITELEITHPQSKTEMQSLIRYTGTSKQVVINSLINYLKALKSGGRIAKFDLQVGQGAQVAASGTFTFTDVPTAGETCTVAGQTLTAVANASTPASGLQFRVGTTKQSTVTNLTEVINAHATIADFLTAVGTNSAVVTITSDVKGTVGNAIGLTEGLTNCAVSGALFTGGVDKTANEYKFGY